MYKIAFMACFMICCSAANAEAWRDCIPNSIGPGGCDSIGPGGGKALGRDTSRGLNTDTLRPYGDN